MLEFLSPHAQQARCSMYDAIKLVFQLFPEQKQTKRPAVTFCTYMMAGTKCKSQVTGQKCRLSEYIDG